jgi:TM2 domain-containing membrane protein YozV
MPPYLADAHSKKMLAGLMALFLGNLGIHKFVLGYTTAGVITIAINFTCIGAPIIRIITLIEGIMYLTKTDEEFYQTYIANKKEWF